jgi:hypothetical protein
MQSVSTPDKALTKPTAFLNYIHNFRGFAILAIVSHHSIATLQWHDSRQEAIALILIGNGSVYFVFIAGFLFQFLSSKYRYNVYLKKKINYVIIPYVLTATPAIILAIAGRFPSPDWFNERFSDLPMFGQWLMYLLTGAHFAGAWFIPMITIFYIVSPVLFWIDQNPKVYWVLPVLILVTLIVPRPSAINNPFQAFIHFLSIYIAGMICAHFREEFFSFMSKRYLWLVCAFISLTALQFWVKEIPSSVNSLSKLILCTLLIYVLWRTEARTPKVINGLMGRLAELSFGIYFLHEYFLGYNSGIARRLNIHSSLSQANLLDFSISLVLVLSGSIVLILAIQKIFGKHSRFIVGC